MHIAIEWTSFRKKAGFVLALLPHVSWPLSWPLLLVALAGCAHVAPYERGSLANPTMTTDSTATALEEHVRSISEGGSGGVSGGGGGCGCN